MRSNLERNRTELLVSITHPLYYNKPNKNLKVQYMYLAQLLQCFCRRVMLVSASKQCHSPEVVTRYVILWFASSIIDIIHQIITAVPSPEKVAALLQVSVLLPGIGYSPKLECPLSVFPHFLVDRLGVECDQVREVASGPLSSLRCWSPELWWRSQGPGPSSSSSR